MRPRVNTEKHIVQSPVFVALASSKVEVDVVTVNNALAVASDVRVGAVVTAIYLEYWFLAGGQQPGSFVSSLEKRPAGASQMTFGESNSLTTYDNKKNILYTTQGLIGDANANPTPVYRQWFKIPKGKQRFGLGDVLTVNFTSLTEDMDVCGLAIFKEQF